jgi:hypothetical protein
VAKSGTPIMPAVGRLRQEDGQFKGSLGYTARPCSPPPTPKKKKKVGEISIQSIISNLEWNLVMQIQNGLFTAYTDGGVLSNPRVPKSSETSIEVKGVCFAKRLPGCLSASL